jgi:hypothetical protein
MTAVTVPVAELRRRLGTADDGSGRMLVKFAADLGVTLDLVEGWDGRVCVPAEQAAAMVATLGARMAERMASKNARRLLEEAAAAEREAELEAACVRAYDVAFLDALLSQARNPHLIAFERSAQVAQSGDPSAAPTIEEGVTARQRLVDGGLYPKPKRWGWLS